MIWIHVLNMHTKSGHRTGRSPWQATKSGLKPIAFLKKWIKKKETSVPRYLTGREKKQWQIKKENLEKEQEMKKENL